MAAMTSNGNVAQALQRINARDMLVVPETADQIIADLTRFAEADPAKAADFEAAAREQIALAYGYGDNDNSETRKPFVYQDGIAVIPIHGTLINRFNSSWGFVTGYNYIRRMMNAALDDDDVTLIAYDVDSPGGEAAGCFELAREMMASRRVKPSIAIVDSVAASGGMALAGAATQMVAIPSARVGSIGVYRMHISVEKALADAGIKITFASAGDHKVDGNPYQDLPQRVLDEWRAEAGKTWDDFIALVAEARDMSEADVRATQARVYRADEALAKGLINAVNTPAEAVAAFVAELADDEPSEEDGEDEMTTDTKKGGSEATSGLSQADLEKIGAVVSAGLVTAMTAQNRITAIKAHGASVGQVALASKLAANAAISEEDAIGMIDDAAAAAAPKGKQKAAAPKSKQKAAEPDEDDDDLGEDDDEDGEGDDDADADEDDDDGENAADAARSRRQNAKGGRGKQKAKGGRGRDQTDYFANAMSNDDHPNVGAGGEKRRKGKGGEASAASLLADHAAATGADWSKKAAGNA
jgi:signal peptide peptidase SppA